MAKRRGHGEGSIYQDSRGRWIAEIDVGRDHTGKRQRRKRTARTRREAQQKLSVLEAEVASNLDLDGTNVTVNDLLDRVIHHARDKGRQPKTIENYEWAASHLRTAFGAMKARELTALQIESHLQELVKERKLSRSSLVRINGTLKQALDEGLRHDWLTRNVANVARTPASHTTTRQALTPEQARTLITEAVDTRLHAAVVVGITCALRPGEILGLTWTNLNLDEDPPTLSITHSLKHDGTGTYLGDLKTSTSHRTVALSGSAVGALKAHRRCQNADRLAAGPLWDDHDLVLANELGRGWNPHNFRRDFRTLTQRAGLGKLPPYTMRHTAVTLLSNAGVPAERIADLAGHRDTRMVERVYRHRSSTLDVGREEMARVIG